MEGAVFGMYLVHEAPINSKQRGDLGVHSGSSDCLVDASRFQGGYIFQPEEG
jgi:hypothetical protein